MSRLFALPLLRDIAVPSWMPESNPPVSLGFTEVRRRLWHMLPGTLPFLLWIIPHRDPWGWPLLISATAIIVLISFGMIVRFRLIDRGHAEQSWLTVLGYSGPILLGLWWCRGREEIPLMALGIMAFGDGMATLGGKRLGGWKLPWNPRKTWTGWACFVIAGTMMGGLIAWGESRPGVELFVAWKLAAVAAFLTSFVESIPAKGNDNLRVSSTALLACLMVFS